MHYKGAIVWAVGVTEGKTGKWVIFKRGAGEAEGRLPRIGLSVLVENEGNAGIISRVEVGDF